MATLLTIGNTYNTILIIDNTCKQHQYSVIGEWISKLWYIHRMEYYSIELHIVKVYKILAKWTDANISESLVKEKSVKFNVDFGLQL